LWFFFFCRFSQWDRGADFFTVGTANHAIANTFLWAAFYSFFLLLLFLDQLQCPEQNIERETN
jgi:hypothetical protein